MKKNILVSTIIAIIFTFSAWAAPVNVNTASVQELKVNLIGVGENKAKAIVTYRKKNGPFTTFASLKKVKGIGEKILEKNKNDIVFK